MAEQEIAGVCVQKADENRKPVLSIDNMSSISSEELGELIKKLDKLKRRAKAREETEKKKKRLADKKATEEAEKAREEAHIREVTCMDLPLDWTNVFDTDLRTQGVHTDSIPDALILSLSTLGKVDIEYIASVTGAQYKTVIQTLRGSIYQNPETWEECFYKGWETADEYLSGNLKHKWRAARKANKKYNGYFSENLSAIRKIYPAAVDAQDIYITLGSPWVPTDIIDEFILHICGDPFSHTYLFTNQEKDVMREHWKTNHDEITGTWQIPDKARYHHSIAVRKTYGTGSIEALHILERTLNMRNISVTEEVQSPVGKSGKRRVISQEETVAALEKQQKMIREFQDWVWRDEKRKARLESIFDDRFGRIRARKFHGGFLDFPGMSSSVSLYPYQKDAVARIIFTPNTLLAHDVGAGKTFVMIAAGQELKRMGLSKKNLYVVPNMIVGQWETVFLRMYPDARLLCVDPKSFLPNRREAVLGKIRDGDYDGIIIAYSCFEQIPLSREYYLSERREEMERIRKVLSEKGKNTDRLWKKLQDLRDEISDLERAAQEEESRIFFDELGITRLFVDEAHNYEGGKKDVCNSFPKDFYRRVYTSANSWNGRNSSSSDL